MACNRDIFIFYLPSEYKLVFQRGAYVFSSTCRSVNMIVEIYFIYPTYVGCYRIFIFLHIKRNNVIVILKL
jgi:hypothetical protein